LLWIARDAAFRAGETTTSFLAQRLDESIFANTAPPPDAAILGAAALLVDGRAPWRIGDVSVPLRLQHGADVIEFVADATEQRDAWRISGERTGLLQARRAGQVVHATFEATQVAGVVTYDGRSFSVHIDGRAWRFAPAAPPSIDAAGASHAALGGALVIAPMPGKIVKTAVKPGDRVEERSLLIVLEAMKMEHRIEASAAATVTSLLVKEGQIVASGTPLVELS
jgi:propionyl-CoA carboxylase alpha chain